MFNYDRNDKDINNCLYDEKWSFDEQKKSEFEKNRKQRKISFFKALIWLRIEANQTCQRTAKLFMENLLPNGVLEKLRICQ